MKNLQATRKMSSAERRQRWEAAQEAHVVATIVLLAHQSELLLSTLPRHAAALAQAATSTTRAGGDVAELQQAVRALSLRTVAEQLRLRALRALQRAMQRAAPGLLMTTCRKGLGALTRSADLQAVWSQITEATRGSGHSAALVRHVHDSAAVPLLVQRLCRAALLSTPTPQPTPSALLSGLLSLGGWGRGLGSPAPLPPPEPPGVTPASSSRRSAPPRSSCRASAEEAEAEAEAEAEEEGEGEGEGKGEEEGEGEGEGEAERDGQPSSFWCDSWRPQWHGRGYGLDDEEEAEDDEAELGGLQALELQQPLSGLELQPLTELSPRNEHTEQLTEQLTGLDGYSYSFADGVESYSFCAASPAPCVAYALPS